MNKYKELATMNRVGMNTFKEMATTSRVGMDKC